jgi:hypothetical protein
MKHWVYGTDFRYLWRKTTFLWNVTPRSLVQLYKDCNRLSRPQKPEISACNKAHKIKTNKNVQEFTKNVFDENMKTSAYFCNMYEITRSFDIA